MAAHPGIVEVLGLAASISLLSGWRLYLCILGTGFAMRSGVLPLPEHLAALGVLANPWVMGTAGFAALCEFFADKLAWLDSVWDTIHTLIRPLGGALLALAIVDPGRSRDPGGRLHPGRRRRAAGARRQGRRAGGGQRQPGTVQQCHRLLRRGRRHRRPALRPVPVSGCRSRDRRVPAGGRDRTAGARPAAVPAFFGSRPSRRA